MCHIICWGALELGISYVFRHFGIVYYFQLAVYCILELKMEFWHKKPFSIRFVHKIQKIFKF